MEKNLEFNKLADIVVWADGIIRDAGYNEEKYKSDGATAYCHVKAHELWKIRDVALKSMERQTVYSDALNKDIADKAAKIELLEKEIEGRKEGYWALKEKYDKFEEELDDKNDKIKRQRENLDTLNKTLEIRTKENESLIKVRNNLNKEIEAHESENARLTDKIKELKKERDKHIIDRNATIMQLEKQVKDLEKELNETCTCKELDLKGHNRREMALVNELADKNDEIKKLKESIEYYKNQERIRTDQLRATESKVEELWEEIERLRDLGEHWKRSYFNIRYSLNKLKDESKEDDHGRKGFKEYIEWLVKEEERAVPERFKERLNEEITAIFTKEEETKVNDIPCGEDSIE